MQMQYEPVRRIHMIDCARQTLEERADHAHRLGDFLAGMIVGACLLFGIVTFWGWL